jgi:hypothetical protein
MKGYYCSDDCNTFILYRNNGDATFQVDGCHGPDKDLTKTFQWLENIWGHDQYLKLTLSTGKQDGWPTLVDITDEVKAVAKGKRVYDPTFANIVRQYNGKPPLTEQEKAE